jgi:hypothetical protein
LVLPSTPLKKERRVFAPPEMWESVDEAAAFHSDAYKELGIKETLPSNELAVELLTWALDLFWKDKGGRPKNATDRAKKVVAFAETLKADLAAKKSNDNNR